MYLILSMSALHLLIFAIISYYMYYYLLHTRFTDGQIIMTMVIIFLTLSIGNSVLLYYCHMGSAEEPIRGKCSIEDFENLIKIDDKTGNYFLDQEYMIPSDKALLDKRKRDQAAGNKIKKDHKYDMKSDTGNPLNTIPLGENPYENDYSYMPPSNWMRPFERPPVCVTNKRCPVQPVYSELGYADLLQYDDTHVMAPTKINI